MFPVFPSCWKNCRGALFYRAWLPVAGIMVAASMDPIQGQTTAYSVPQGSLMVNIPAAANGVPSVTTFSLPMSMPVPATFVGQYVGQITGVTASTITNSSGGWTPGALSQASTPYFIRITSGAAAGQTFQISTTAANTSTVLNVLNQTIDLTTLGIATGANGDTYEIFPGDTLASLFGTSTLGSSDPATADTVQINQNGVWNEYYYNTAVGQWRTGSFPIDESNLVLRPDSGITFYRRGTTPLSYVIAGKVPRTNIQIVVKNTGVTYVGNVFPIDQTLLASNYNSLPDWVNNTGSAITASAVEFWNGLVYNSYQFLPSINQWRIGSFPINENNIVIPAGTPIIFGQPSTTTGIGVLTRILPYSLN